MKKSKKFSVTFDKIIKNEFNAPIEIEYGLVKKLSAKTFADARSKMRGSYKYDIKNLVVRMA